MGGTGAGGTTGPARRLVSWAAAAAIAAAAVVTGTVLHTPRAGASTSVCFDDFESGTDSWSPWWAGSIARSTQSAHNGAASLALTGSPATAQRLLDPRSCANAADLSFWVRATGDASLYVKLVDQSTGTATVVGENGLNGKWSVTSTWRLITIHRSLTSPTTLMLEAYPGSGTVFLDDVLLDWPVISTRPPTTARPGPSCNETFESITGTGGWTSWWSGTVEVSPGSATGRWLVLSDTQNTGAATAVRTLQPSDCPGASHLSFVARSSFLTAKLYVKFVDQVTGASVVRGPFSFDESWTPIDVAFAITNPTTVGIEAYPPGFGRSVSLDDITFSATGPSTTQPPATTAPPTTTPSTTAPPQADPCVQGFEIPYAAPWTLWWNPGTGTLSTMKPRSGQTSLELSGPQTPKTATVDLDTRTCASTPASVTMYLSTGAGTANAYVKVLGGTSVVGPVRITTGWTAVTIPGPLSGPFTLGIEAYLSDSSSALYVDDLTIVPSGATPTTTTRTTTTPTTSTTATPTTTTTSTTAPPPNETDCLVENLASGSGNGFSQWWNGDPRDGLFGFPGDATLTIRGTARKVIRQSLCTSPVTSVRVELNAKAGDHLVVRRFDLATGAEQPSRTVALTGGRQAVTVPISVATTLLGLEVWTPTSATASVLSEATIAGFAYRSLSGPAVSYPSGLVAGARNLSRDVVTVSVNERFQSAEVRVALRQRNQQVSDPGRVDADARAGASACGKGGCDWMSVFEVSGLSTWANGGSYDGGWEGVVESCGGLGGGCTSSSFLVPEVRPQPAGACRIEEYDGDIVAFGGTQIVAPSAWTALDDGSPTVAANFPDTGAGKFVQFGTTIIPVSPSSADFTASAQRLILPSDCPSPTITSLRIDTLGGFGSGTMRMELLDPVTGQVTPYVNGAPLPAIPTGGLVLRVRFRGPVFTGLGPGYRGFGVTHLVLFG